MTPLERAARSLAQARYGYEAWEQEDDDGRARLLSEAHAVIDAIREPSEAMWDAGDDHCPHRDTANPAKVWAAMIDALLANENDPVDYDEADGPTTSAPRIGPEFRRSELPIRVSIDGPAGRK